MQYRSKARGGAQDQGTAEKAKSGVLGEAYKLSQKIRGEGRGGGGQDLRRALPGRQTFTAFCPVHRRR